MKMVEKEKELLIETKNKSLSRTVEIGKAEIKCINNQKSALETMLVQKPKPSKFTNTDPVTFVTGSSDTSLASDLAIDSSQHSCYPSSTLCSHTPQCCIREPQSPPASFPLNRVDHHDFFEPRVPPNIRLLPSHVGSVQIFYSL